MTNDVGVENKKAEEKQERQGSASLPRRSFRQD